MSQRLFLPRGTQDTFGENVRKWQHIERLARDICERYNIQEFRTPMYEHTEVFKRQDDASDVVNKEMYTFVIKNKDGESPSLTLRPEGTAGLVRAFVQNKLYATGSSYQKYFYIAPNFRYERPQKGRMRIHHQFAVEFLGPNSPYADVEAILTGLTLLKELGITKFKLMVNTLGDEASQAEYKHRLKEHFAPYLETMCADCNRRFVQNPLRILDCKVDHDHEAMHSSPSNEASLNEESKAYFESFKALLTMMNIDYAVDDRLVRGLDYYHHTVFEVVSTDENVGAQSTIFGGGRYNKLVEYFGGPETPAVGFGMGIERLLILAEASNVAFDVAPRLDAFVMPRDGAAKMYAFNVMQSLRDHGLHVDMDIEDKSFKAQFKMVDRTHSRVAIMVGEQEMNDQTLSLKNIDTQETRVVSLSEASDVIKQWIGA